MKIRWGILTSQNSTRDTVIMKQSGYFKQPLSGKSVLIIESHWDAVLGQVGHPCSMQATYETKWKLQAKLHSCMVIVNRLIWLTDHKSDFTDQTPTTYCTFTMRGCGVSRPKHHIALRLISSQCMECKAKLFRWTKCSYISQGEPCMIYSMAVQNLTCQVLWGRNRTVGLLSQLVSW